MIQNAQSWSLLPWGSSLRIPQERSECLGDCMYALPNATRNKPSCYLPPVPKPTAEQRSPAERRGRGGEALAHVHRSRVGAHVPLPPAAPCSTLGSWGCCHHPVAPPRPLPPHSTRDEALPAPHALLPTASLLPHVPCLLPASRRGFQSQQLSVPPWVCAVCSRWRGGRGDTPDARGHQQEAGGVACPPCTARGKRHGLEIKAEDLMSEKRAARQRGASPAGWLVASAPSRWHPGKCLALQHNASNRSHSTHTPSTGVSSSSEQREAHSVHQNPLKIPQKPASVAPSLLSLHLES